MPPTCASCSTVTGIRRAPRRRPRYGNAPGVPLLALTAVQGGSDVLAPRLGRVGAAAAGLAELLAVAGDRYPVFALGAASGLDEDALGAALDELAGAGLVEPAASTGICYEFTHALFREALNTRLTDLRRVALSRRLLGAADLLPRKVLPSATAHYAVAVARSGGPSDVVRAREECQLAAEVAAAGHEHHEAAGWLCRAVELAGESDADTRTVAELELGYGIAARRAGLPDARDAFLRAAAMARSGAHPELFVRVGVGWSRGFFSQTGQVDGDFVAILREALVRPQKLPPPLRARAAATLAAEPTWAPDCDERFALADAALDIARATGDPATVAEVLRTRHLTVAAADTLAAGRRDTEELLALAERLDDIGLRFEALFHSTGPAIADGDVAVVERLLGAAGQIAETLRQPALAWSIGWSRASLLLWQGSLAAAEKLAVESADHGVTVGHATEAYAFLGGQLLEIRRLQGRLAELVPALDAVPPTAPHSLTVARYLCVASEVEAARARLARFAPDSGPLRLRRDMLERPLLDDLAFLAARLDRPDLAASVRVRLEPLADTFGHAVVAHPVGHHWLGVLALAQGRTNDAVTHLGRAIARHAAADLPLLEAESLIELARARDSIGDRSGAVRARAAARELADRQSAAGLVAEVSSPTERNP